MSKDDLLAHGYTQFTPVQLAKSRGFSCGLTVAVQCPVDPLTSIGIHCSRTHEHTYPVELVKKRTCSLLLGDMETASTPSNSTLSGVSLMASAMSDLALLFDVV